jgi:Tol biopolymer transport system component
MLGELSDAPYRIMEYELASGARRDLFWANLQAPFVGYGHSTLAVLGGDRVLVGEYAVQSGLYEVSWSGVLGAKPRRALTKGLAKDRQPAFSPDGDRIIFSSNRSANLDLWIVDRCTRELVQLTDDPAHDMDPAFTPDGSRVLWSSNRSGNVEIWMAAADGSGARQVTHDGVDAENPTMTPDGEWIVYASTNDEKLGVWKIRPDGSEATRLASGSYGIPDVSPDGRYAAFRAFKGATKVAIQVVVVETGELVPFEIELHPGQLHENVLVGRTRWAPDGRALVFIGQDDEGRFGVFVQDFAPGADTSGSRRAVAGFWEGFNSESLGVSPDGSRVVLAAKSDSRRLRVAEGVSLSGWH